MTLAAPVPDLVQHGHTALNQEVCWNQSTQSTSTGMAKMVKYTPLLVLPQ